MEEKGGNLLPALVGRELAGARSPAQLLAQCSTEGARELIPRSWAARNGVLPLAIYSSGKGSTGVGSDLLSIALPKCSDAGCVQELRAISGCELEVELCEREVIEEAIEYAYSGSSENLKLHSELAEKSVSRVATDDDIQISDTPTPVLFDSLMSRALFLGASDIHLEPRGAQLSCRLRVDGLLRDEPAFSLSMALGDELIRRIKVLAKIDICMSNKPQEGGFDFHQQNSVVRVRVSILPQQQADKVVLRILSSNYGVDTTIAPGDPRVFKKLGLSEQQTHLLVSQLALCSGTILLTGPTGSGKSTLLYACLHYLNAPWRSIATIEDPVERIIPGISQTPVAPEKGVDYQQVLPRLLRQDPDVIMLGEMRDRETTCLGLEAGLTGHLVLSSLHLGSVCDVYERLHQLGAPESLIRQSLKFVIAQRLIPLNCSRCRVQLRGNKMIYRLFSIPAGHAIYQSDGCADCKQSGVDGRQAVFEFLRTNQPEKIGNGPGFSNLALEIRGLLLAGKISPKWAFRALGLAPEVVDLQPQ